MKHLVTGFAVFLLLSGCARDEPIQDPIEPSATFGSGSVLLVSATDTVPLSVEIAETAEQRSQGLMHRASLAADSGMIFLFDTVQPADGVFWMFNTLIPLSIAFIGEDGRIGSIRDMEPCESPYPQWCPNYEAGVPFTSALEVNSGYFGTRQVAVGDEVILRRE